VPGHYLTHSQKQPLAIYQRLFLFWNSIHPTTAAHLILGEAAFEAIQLPVRSFE
jgi:phospholipase/lecithinase/hemolysin